MSVIPIDGLCVDDSFSYEEVSVDILDRKVIRLSNTEVASVNVLWRNHLVEGSILEAEADMKSYFPYLLTN